MEPWQLGLFIHGTMAIGAFYTWNRGNWSFLYMELWQWKLLIRGTMAIGRFSVILGDKYMSKFI